MNKEELLEQSRKKCQYCHGTGSENYLGPRNPDCRVCNGTGKTEPDLSRICIKAEDQELPDMVFFCEDCQKMVKNTMCNIVEDNWVKVCKKT